MIAGIGTVSATMFIAWIAGVFGVPPPQVIIQPGVVPPATVKTTSPPPDLAYGWIPDQAEIVASRAAVPIVFRDSPAGSEQAIPDKFYQWQVQNKVSGQQTHKKNQNPVGSCVGFGSTTAYERALSCSIAAGQPFEFTRFSEEASYAIGRVNIGKGRLRGQDGSIGGWQIRGQTEVGMVPAKKYIAGDFTEYNPTRCRQLGDRGLPDELLKEAANYKAGAAANIKAWTDAKNAIANGAGVYVCSMIGFNRQRDFNGVCSPQGQWGHCMCLDGFHKDERGREYGHFDNSWGTIYHTGPVGWGAPTEAGFWADARVISQMLAEGDSWAVSAVKGFPKQDIKLDWFLKKDDFNLHRDDVFAVFSLAH